MKIMTMTLAVFSFLVLSSERVLAIEESSFCESHVPGSYILPSDGDSWTWGMAPIYDEAGKLHIFNSVIPNKGSWIKDSKIVHWTADSVEGPYTLEGDLLSSDEASYHNPQISKVDDTYVLVYLYNKHNDENGSMQEVGIATAKSLDGPWQESPHNPIIPASGEMGGATINHASNPTFVAAPDGKFRVYYKSMTTKHKFREISLAMSDQIEGPYENHTGNPVLSYADKQLDIEDPYAFYYKDRYWMIVEDRRGVKDMLEGNPLPANHKNSGGLRPGLIYTSKDGLDWGLPEVGYLTNEMYFGEKLARSERPHILWKDGRPEYLFLACHDKDPTAGYYVKIDQWNEEE
ncbi:Extracellular endo-alpha-(1-_5)-L-arabinanase 2 precursor [Novipirellula aureliae]|uniref:Extracellular endo-alpha-(1->5)-L-arabinanase 2 n=1 Tax=Novipirellula aureliae TaxID=2527966 RepID=A0A5C6E3Q8_9BACT|nr:glycoside hydrolase family protein [Novipirellula aureliae]TWU44313.1 Extracellular endo-alpha-(1->5)-L-arabinanase 2 precursor [Novipirellula aureliae]